MPEIVQERERERGHCEAVAREFQLEPSHCHWGSLYRLSPANGLGRPGTDHTPYFLFSNGELREAIATRLLPGSRTGELEGAI